MSENEDKLRRRLEVVKNQLNKAHVDMTMAEANQMQSLADEKRWIEKKLKEMTDAPSTPNTENA